VRISGRRERAPAPVADTDRETLRVGVNQAGSPNPKRDKSIPALEGHERHGYILAKTGCCTTPSELSPPNWQHKPPKSAFFYWSEN
jgi:hypothetical protein